MTTLITSVGYPAAGKSIVSDQVETKDIPVIKMGDRLRKRFVNQDKDELKEELDVSNESELLGEWATVQREKHGSDVVAKWTADYIENNTSSEIVFVDGLRSLEELNRFNSLFDDVYVIYVEASFQTRLNRIRERGRDGESDFSAEDLESRDAREDSWGMNNVVSEADYTIVNEGSLDTFKEKIQDTLTDIRKSS